MGDALTSGLSSVTTALELALGSADASVIALTVSADIELPTGVVLAARPPLTLTGNLSACSGARTADGVAIPGLCTLRMAAAPGLAPPLTRHFTLTGGASLTLRSLALTDGVALADPDGVNNGGALLADELSTLVLSDTLLYNNSADLGGAIIFASSAPGALVLTNCTLLNNTAGRYGGGVYFQNMNGESGALQADNCTFAGNTAGWAGGVVAGAVNVTASGSRFIGNQATGLLGYEGTGGALSLQAGAVLVATDCVFEANRALAGGAAFGASVTVSNSRFQGNIALGGLSSSGGGAIALDSLTGSVLLDACTLVNNSAAGAAGSGGALLVSPGDFGGAVVVLSRCTLSGNSAAAADGGAIALRGSSVLGTPTGNLTVSLSGVQCIGNIALAGAGGCMAAAGAATLSITGSLFASNAAFSGGALAVACVDEALCTMVHNLSACTFVGNTAALQGGALRVLGGELRAADCVFYANAASGVSAQGGALFLSEFGVAPLPSLALALDNTTFAGNAAAEVRPSQRLAAGRTFTVAQDAGCGGALLVAAANGATTVALRGSRLEGNRASVCGGAAFLYGPIALNASACVFVNNSAPVGGALQLQSAEALAGAAATLTGCNFTANAAGAGAALALNSNSSLSAAGCAFKSNGDIASTYGAVLLLQVAGAGAAPPPRVSLSDVVAAGNAAFAGALFYVDAPVAVAPAPCAGACALTGNAAVNGPLGATAPLRFNASTDGGALAARCLELGVPPFSVTLFDALGGALQRWPYTFASVALAPAAAAAGLALSGPLKVPYDSGAAAFQLLSLVGAAGVNATLIYTLTSSGALGASLEGATGAVPVAVTPCAALEAFDADLGLCVCVERAKRDADGVRACNCVAGFYDTSFGAGAPDAVCDACPPGGLCVNGVLSADEGWWREFDTDATFLQCREGYCVLNGTATDVAAAAATAANSTTATAAPPAFGAQCADGHQGVLCAVCLPGYALQGGFCRPCGKGEDWEEWNAARQGILLAFSIVAALFALTVAFFEPLLPAVERSLGVAGEAVTGAARSVKRFFACGRVAASCLRRLRRRERASASASAPATPRKPQSAPADVIVRGANLHAEAVEHAGGSTCAEARAARRPVVGTLGHPMTDSLGLGAGLSSSVLTSHAKAQNGAPQAQPLDSNAAVDTDSGTGAGAGVGDDGGFDDTAFSPDATAADASQAIDTATDASEEVLNDDGGVAEPEDAPDMDVADSEPADAPDMDVVSAAEATHDDAPDDADADAGVDPEVTEAAAFMGDEAGLDAVFGALLALFMAFMKPIRIAINFFQIVSSFITTLNVPWPTGFAIAMARVNVINFNWLQLPSVACLHPSPSFYRQFNGARRRC